MNKTDGLLASVYEQLDCTNEKLIKTNKNLEDVNENLKNELDDVNENLKNELTKTNKNLEDTNENLKNSLNDTNENLKNELTKTNKNLEETNENLRKEIDVLRNELSEIDGKIPKQDKVKNPFKNPERYASNLEKIGKEIETIRNSRIKLQELLFWEEISLEDTAAIHEFLHEFNITKISSDEQTDKFKIQTNLGSAIIEFNYENMSRYETLQKLEYIKENYEELLNMDDYLEEEVTVHGLRLVNNNPPDLLVDFIHPSLDYSLISKLLFIIENS